jgi:hypothetical protein
VRVSTVKAYRSSISELLYFIARFSQACMKGHRPTRMDDEQRPKWKDLCHPLHPVIVRP